MCGNAAENQEFDKVENWIAVSLSLMNFGWICIITDTDKIDGKEPQKKSDLTLLCVLDFMFKVMLPGVLSSCCDTSGYYGKVRIYDRNVTYLVWQLNDQGCISEWEKNYFLTSVTVQLR